MKRVDKLLISFVLMLFVFACTKSIGDEDVSYSINNKHIKSISANGTISHKFFYDQKGKIVEENCLYYFHKYVYDENERLVKVESAWDSGLLSSSMPVVRTEFMTSKNSAADRYSLYQYENNGRLSTIENYFNYTGSGFEHRSTQTFEYKGSLIVKVTVTLHMPPVQITGFTVYTYDNKGNVIKEKMYSSPGTSNETVTEKSYKYDNYKNPYRIFSMVGTPGLWTNVNNIIETSESWNYNIPGLDSNSTEKRSFKYNSNGYPVKEITQSGEFEYNY